MSVDRDDQPGDEDLLSSLARLPICDISQRRSRQLRRRCHALLQGEPPMDRWSLGVDGAFRREIVPALGGVWCLAYLAEIVRCTAAIYGYLGNP